MADKEQLTPIQLDLTITEILKPARINGDWQLSSDQLTLLLPLPEVADNSEYQAQVLVARGFTHRMLGQYDQAFEDFGSVVNDLSTLENPTETRYQALIGLADVHRVGFSNHNHGHALLQEVIKQDEYPELKAKAFDQAGLLWSAQGKVDVSVFWYQQALTITEDFIKQSDEKLSDQTLEFQELVANFYTHLGVAQEKLGHASAINTQKQALKIYQSIGNQRGQFNSLSALGRIHTNLGGDLQKALSYYKHAEAFTGGDKRAEASLYLVQTHALFKLDSFEDAKTAFANFTSRLGPNGFTQHDQDLQKELIAALNVKLSPTDQQE